MTMIEPATVDEGGRESHPAYGLIGASRTSVGGLDGGAVLFDSDILHNHTVRVRIKTASRKRDLHHDWIYGDHEIIEVEMSEAQWASFVSSMNVGDGVPCTIRYVNNERVPEMAHEPRLDHSIRETHDAADRAFEQIKAAMDAYDALDSKAPARERKEALGVLRAVIRNAVPNVDFAGQSLVEHAENVVTKARADIEAFVVVKARQLGIDVNELDGGSNLAIGRGQREG